VFPGSYYTRLQNGPASADPVSIFGEATWADGTRG
jgi:hypothetical protein